MPRSCVIELEGSWDRYLPLAEFTYNNSYQASIQMAPYEALYGRKCRTPVCWTELGEDMLVRPDLVKQTKEKVKIIKAKHYVYALLKISATLRLVGFEDFLELKWYPSCP